MAENILFKYKEYKNKIKEEILSDDEEDSEEYPEEEIIPFEPDPEDMLDGKEALKELIMGIVILGFLMLFGLLVTENKLQYFIGILVGTGVSVILSFHMYTSIDRALCLDYDGAVRYSRKMAVVRMLIMAVSVVFAVFLSDYISLIGVILGIMTLKLSAYIQPLTHKLFYKKIKSKGR